MGAAYTIADQYLFTFAQWLEADGVDLVRVPRAVDHRRRMMERSLVKKALAQELPN
jgi:glutathione S-transferase